MTAYIFLCVLLVTAGLFILFGVRPEDITKVLFKVIIQKRQQAQRRNRITGKKPRGLSKTLASAKAMLEEAGMGKSLSSYRWKSVIFALIGLSAGILIDNILASIVLATGGALIPLVTIYMKTAMYMRLQDEQLESGMTSVTTAYQQSGDLIAAVESSLAQIPSPLDNVFKLFLVDAKLLDANIPKAILNMKDRKSNPHWQDWCEILYQCHADRQLRDALPGVVQRLGETRRAQMEVDTKLKQQFQSYVLTVLIVLGSIPMMAAIMPQWFEMLMYTVPGKITLAFVLFVILCTLLWVVRVFRPIDDGGKQQ